MKPQRIFVEPTFTANSSLKLLDLPDDLAKQVLSGRTVFIKGGPEDDLVLCTEDSTFSLRFVESSNTMLLAAPPTRGGASEFRVHGSVGGILEVRLCASHVLVGRLRILPSLGTALLPVIGHFAIAPSDTPILCLQGPRCRR